MLLIYHLYLPLYLTFSVILSPLSDALEAFTSVSVTMEDINNSNNKVTDIAFILILSHLI